MKTFIEKLPYYAPENKPLHWLVINLLCCLTSFGLFLDLLIATDNLLERPFSEAYYLTWSFATTVVWLFEIGLKVSWALVYEVDNDPTMLSWNKKLELALAVVFTVNTGWLLYEWDLKEGNIKGQLWEVSLTALGYLYFVFEYAQNKRKMEIEPVSREGSDFDPTEDSAIMA